MFALVLFVCYLDGGCEDIVVDVYNTEQQCLYSMSDQRIRHGGCEDIVVDVYNTEQQCLYSMSDQRIRHGGCFPIEDFIDGFWRPAQEYGDF
ncbi:YebW family protein [Escherichia coli]|nr:YebW family protein [Escherichia coli]